MQIRMFDNPEAHHLALIISPDPTQRVILKTSLAKTALGSSVVETDSVAKAMELIKESLAKGLGFSTIIIDRDSIGLDKDRGVKGKAWEEYMAGWDEYMEKLIQDIRDLEKRGQKPNQANITIFSQTPDKVCKGTDKMLPQPLLQEGMDILHQSVKSSLGPILIVDDEPANHLILGIKIKGTKVPLDGKIHTAVTGSAALMMIEERLKATGSNYPIIILDREMPHDMGGKIISEEGIEVSRAIRALESKYNVPSERQAFITCYSTRVQSTADLYPGANAFLSKPLTPESTQELKGILSSYVDRASIEQQEATSRNSSPRGIKASAASTPEALTRVTQLKNRP